MISSVVRGFEGVPRVPLIGSIVMRVFIIFLVRREREITARIRRID